MRKISANNDLMTTREAGELLGVAVRTVQLWVESGVLPAWRTAGGHRRIARSAVDKLMAQRAQVFDTLTSTNNESIATQLPLKLLVVEDDANLLRLTVSMIESWDFPVSVSTASNGFEGLLRIGQSSPDIVLTDLNMPGMDGFEMIRSLKKSDSGVGRLKLVVLSALTPDEISARGGLPEGVAYFPKPVHYGRLQALVRELQVSGR